MALKKPIKPDIRELKQHETGVLRELFYYAIFMPEDADPLPFSIVDHLDLIKYHQEWGRKGDIAMVADLDGKIIGITWCRLWENEEKGYGFIDNDIPELGVAILPEYRNKGIGTGLIKQMLNTVKEAGFKALSVSVEKRNRAVKLYKRLGFSIVKDKFPDYIMRIDL